ncbi:type I polyketide synthase [Aspergillus stella-maris]|uniref:type I polyketide synthase n=1 Tax=Aspergillus stella-maris TaxID=1810926 RepID=UPI003CCD33E0
MRTPTSPSESGRLKPLAVVGLALRYPGDAVSPDKFWRMLMERRCASSRYPADRLNIDAHYNPTGNRQDTLSVDGGHFLTGDMGAFDPAFFSMTAAEAEGMDPQQRMALELSYQALENAGVSMDEASGTRTCVFTGCCASDYGALYAKDPQFAGKYVGYTQAMSMVANRISWFFNLQGPSANVDTACSSSLVALDLACQSIWAGVSSMGLAVGVNLILAREWTNGLDNLGFFSKDNRCLSFDSKANGYSRGEGLGAVVIKPLEDAVRDGDTIRAVIRSTLSNQDGHTPGITLPSRDAQRKLIQEAYSHAGLSPAYTRYFEAHGTGTAVGDPTETRAIGAVFRQHRSEEDPLYVGSVKSNIGHLEGGSGIAGVIKVILSLEHGIIPPVSDHYKSLNKRIDAEHLNLQVVSKPDPWPQGLRRASVNSFGFGGANSHVILEDAYHSLLDAGLDGNHNTTFNVSTNGENGEHTSVEHCQPNGHNGTNGANGHGLDRNSNSNPDTARVLVWSAADKDGLSRIAQNWAEYFQGTTGNTKQAPEYFENLSYTLNQKRSHLVWRCAATFSAVTELENVVDQWSTPVKASTDRTLGFVFTGQGAQWPAMGCELMSRYPVYRTALFQAGEYLQTLGSDWDLVGTLQDDSKDSPIDEPRFAQPLCTAVQIALVDLLSTWGVRPTAVLGHSSGEIAAAYCSGAISREYALRLAYYRGVVGSRLTTSSSMSGAMMAVSLSKEDAEQYISDLKDDEDQAGIVIACLNSPKSTTLSGHRHRIEQLHAILKSQDVLAKILPVPVAYHSFQIQELAASYEAEIGDDTHILSDYTGRPPQMVSSLHGNMATHEELSKAAYWVANLVSPVRFVDALQRFHLGSADAPTKKLDGSHRDQIGIDSWLEIGPHTALRGPCRDTLSKSGTSLEYLPTIMRKANAVKSMIDTAARLHCLGHDIDLQAVNALPDACKTVKPKVLTDLPSYNFNHSKSYWREGRISKGFRFRRFGRHELLGWPDDDWNPMLAKWSNILQPADPVWVQDHKIDNVTILPGASMVTMAIEAIKQVVDSPEAITGYELKNVNFMSALKAPAGGNGAETRFHLRPQGTSTAGSTSWWEFTLFSHDGSWVKNCSGGIKAVIDPSFDPPVPVKKLENQSIACTTALDANRFYEMLNSFGYQFGPAFVRISSIKSDLDHHLLTDVLPYAGSHAHWSEQYTIHPTTLDALMQTVPLLRSHGGTKKIPISIPSHIGRAWISSTGLKAPECQSMKVATTINHFGRQECVSEISVWNQSGETPLIAVEDVIFTSIGSQSEEEAGKLQHRAKCQQIEWKPDVDLMSADDVGEYCSKGPTSRRSSNMTSMQIDTMIHGYIYRAVQLLEAPDRENTSAEAQRYVGWLRHEAGKNERHRLQTSNDEFSELCAEVSGSGAEGALYVKAGEALLEFARGSRETLHISDTLLAEASFVENWRSSPALQHLHSYLDIMAHKEPNMKILEVVDGPAAISAFVLDALAPQSSDDKEVPRLQKLDIVGVQEDTLSALTTKFAFAGDRVARSATDIHHTLDNDVEAQYDLVILNASDSIAELTLSNCRTILKESGRLLLIENDPFSLRRCFTAGPPQSWIADHIERKAEDKISLLAATEFGLGVVLTRDPRVTVYSSGLVNDVSSEYKAQHAILVSSDGSVPQQHLAKSIASTLEHTGTWRVDPLSIGQPLPAETTPETFVCVLCEVDGPMLAALDQATFQYLHELFTSSYRVLWVTDGVGRESSPFFNIADGLFRVLNSEYDGRIFTTLSLENIGAGSEMISRVLNSVQSSTAETEYIERSRILHIPRVVESTPATKALARFQPIETPTLQPWNAESDRKLSLETPGLLDSLHFVKDTDRAAPLPGHMMEVKVKAVGVNFRDLLVMLGRMDQTTVGFECAGIVTRLGADCGDFEVGDHVVGCEFDTYRSYARLQRDTAVRIPAGISFTDAAATPINFVTAWHALSVLANVQPGETVLIHSAAGGTGQAAVQVAQFLGATVVATVGSSQKRELIKTLYGVPDTHLLNSRSTDFAAGVKRLTGGQGADVVLNSLSGDLLMASWESIAPYGRFIEIGKRDIMGHAPLDMYYFQRNVTFSAIDVALMVKERPHLVGRALRAVMPLIANGDLKVSSPTSVYGVGELEVALRIMQGGQSSGKVVIEMRDADNVKAVPSEQAQHYFDPNATYVIAGGLGGLGRGIARWMVTCGARYLILLSRSGARDDEAVALLEELAGNQVTALATPCDITDRSMLEAFLGHASHCMPRIKGCIQSTMVLKDAMFETMNYEQWTSAMDPKVQGTWNLHELLPNGLDFFIMLSSIASTMGNRGQANYAAANSFMDALAHYRTSIGEKATALNMGLFLSAGIAAQSSELQEKYLSTLPFTPVTEGQLHALLAYHCSGLPDLPAQTILGLEPTEAQQRKGPDASYWLRKPAFRHLAMTYSSTGSSEENNDTGNIEASIASATTIEEAAPLITALLVSKLASLLSSPADEFDVKKPLHAYGVDSLVAVEIRNWFAKQVKVDIAVFDLLGGATIEGVGRLVAGKRMA